MVAFNTIPADLATPLFFAEMDNSQASSNTAHTLKRLIIGYANDDAPTHAPEITLLSRPSDAVALAGEGSMLADMANTFRQGDPFGEHWGLALKVNEGIAASARLTLTGTATATGLLSLYLGGYLVPIRIEAGTPARQAGVMLTAAINAATHLPVLASLEPDGVLITCKWQGESGNDIRIELNRGGLAANQATPKGLNVHATAMSNGAGVPDLEAALAAVGDAPFEFICQPWTDTASLNTFAQWMDDAVGRWAWSSMLYGHVYSACRGTPGQLIALGQSRNDPHMTINGFEVDAPRPAWAQAAAFAARQAVFISADPARPTQTGVLTGIDAPREGERFMQRERHSLLTNGIATTCSERGVVRIERAVTTYQRNALGQPDDSYFDSETLHTSAHVIRTLRQRITSKYARHKLAENGTRFGPGAAIVTANIIRAEIIAAYDALEHNGIVENADLFAKHLQVKRNPDNPNRVDVLFPPDYINQLRVFAVLNQFRLQYPNAAHA